MPRSRNILLLRLHVVFLLLIGVAGRPPATSAQESQQDQAEATFRYMDTNHDGRLTMDDANDGNRRFLQDVFTAAGKPTTEAISREEFRQLHEQRRRRQTGSSAPRPTATEPATRPGGASSRTESARVPSRAAERSSTPRSDANRLAGVWRGWIVNGRGENPNTGQMELELRIEGNRITARELGTHRAPSGGLGAGTFQTSGLATSGEIDAVATTGPNAGRRFLGIFELDGDTFRWCSADKNRPRPREMRSSPGNYLMILRRVNP